MDAFADVRPGETCFYEQLIKEFIPERVFDCHAHLTAKTSLVGEGLLWPVELLVVQKLRTERRTIML